ncbi:MAG: Cys-rich peptide radical SAM maturase CcpM [Eubacteriales bacterium]|nr:Cys-rich peptide radical SAM maturase CcpM [Eubacteriales bacterium]
MEEIIKKPFIHLLKTPLGYYIYDVNCNEILEIPGEVYHYLNGEAGAENKAQIAACIDGLKEKGYLKDKHVQVSQNPVTEYYESLINHNLGQITLQVTQQCNLRCEYCVYSGNYENRGHANKKMSLETAKKAIDYAVMHSRDVTSLAISFYGGEPLLAFDLIKECVEYAKHAGEGKRISYSFTTNGTLLTEEKYEFLVRNDFSLLISLDGPENFHNRHRKFANSEKGSFDTLFKNLSNLKKQYPDYFQKNISFNTVLDSENPLNEVVNFTLSNHIVRDSEFSSTLVNPVNAKTQMRTAGNFILEYEYEKFKVLLWKLGRLEEKDISPVMRNHFREFKRIGSALERVNRSEVPEKSHRGGPCLPGVRKLFVTAEGKLYPCERVSESSRAAYMGHIDTGIDLEKALKILNIEKVTSGRCRNCWAYMFCSICVAQADDGKNISEQKILEACGSSRYNAEENLKDYLVLRELGYDYELD